MSRARVVSNGLNNRLHIEDAAAHEWYRFVLSFPPHVARDYLERFNISSEHYLLDPFCGTGTTLVEARKLGIPSIGVEANSMAYFASQVKVDWTPTPEGLIEHASIVASAALARLQTDDVADEVAPPAHRNELRTLPPESFKLLLTDSISPLPLHKTLVLLEAIRAHYDERYHRHELLALANALVFSISNLHFGPEVGVSANKKLDAPVVAPWQANVRAMANDLRELQPHGEAPAEVHQADARQLGDIIKPRSIDAVITSPPYPNEKDYTRTTRLESVLLGFINNKAELQALKRGLLRSNTRNVYKGDADDSWIEEHSEIQRIANTIEARRIELGKTSGFRETLREGH
jgi:hypothetical protein